MNETEICQFLRMRLRDIPLERRRVWTDAELIRWWSDTQRNVRLRSHREPPPTFATVKRMCSDLIGKRAPR